MDDTAPVTPHPAARTTPAGGADIEIGRERTYGGSGVEVERQVPLIDLADPSQDAIDHALWAAAVEVGFFQLANHDIDQEMVDRAFEYTARFFDLPTAAKERRALPPGSNSGWEFKTQVRPSTGTRDQKESYQITRSRMDRLDLWPSDDELPGFRAVMEEFERRNWRLAMRVLSSFARELGFPDEFFTERHDPASETYQSTLRLLHYLPLDPSELAPGVWRAGAHTDFDCLTLLHQVPGQRGLQVSAGRRDDADDGDLEWTPVEPMAGVITCNIGDMLVRWSDDALRSTLHRVRMPRPDEHLGPRYSIAYFAQADTDAIVHGPSGRYEPITAHDYLQQRISANFA